MQEASPLVTGEVSRFGFSGLIRDVGPGGDHGHEPLPDPPFSAAPLRQRDELRGGCGRHQVLE